MPELTVASFNVHWGRGDRRSGYAPFDVADACARLDADLIVLQESWAPDDGVAQHHAVGQALGMEAIVVPMGRSEVEPKLQLVSRADPRSNHPDHRAVSHTTGMPCCRRALADAAADRGGARRRRTRARVRPLGAPRP